jgi:putative tricarboxylic transport membrane protein
MNRYKSTVLIVLMLLLAIGPGTASGAFPEKPITLVVGSGPGAGSDTVCRVVAASFKKYNLLPQPIVVENKVGGSHGVAMAYVAGKKKDPYYLMLTTTLFILTPLQTKLPVNYKDFTPIANLSFDEFVLMVNANSKFKTLKEVVDYARANPETVTMGGAHPGGAESINTYRFEQAAGIKFKYVAFSGGGDTQVALLGGHIDLASGNPGEVIELVRANKVRVLAVIADKRLAAMPDVPTVKEQIGVEVTGGMWRGIVAPAGIPEDARKVLSDAFFKYSQTEDYKKFHKDNMITEGYLDGPGFSKYLDGKNAGLSTELKAMGLLK